MCIIVVVGPHVLGKEERVGWELLSAVAHKKGQNKRIHVMLPFFCIARPEGEATDQGNHGTEPARSLTRRRRPTAAASHVGARLLPAALQ